MENMFSKKAKKSIPKNLNECTAPDSTVTNLHFWSERLENWGRIFFGILIIVGIISTIADTAMMAETSDDLVFPTLLTSAVKWGLYAFIEYCAYHALALLISALALITHNTMISANVALLESGKTNDYAEEPELKEDTESETAAASEAPTEVDLIANNNIWATETMILYFNKDGTGKYEYHNGVNRSYDFIWKNKNDIYEITIDGIVDYYASFQSSKNGQCLTLIRNDLPISDPEIKFEKIDYSWNCQNCGSTNISTRGICWKCKTKVIINKDNT